MNTARLRVAVPRGSADGYPVRIGEGLLERLGELATVSVPADRYAIVADDRVGELYGDMAREALARADLRADLFTFPAGEASKSRESWASLIDRLLAAGYGRDAAVVALGGGVTGDLAGFLAATYMRGLPLVMVPTSLLAMLDSSVGGKTAVDTAGAKNVVGAFHHPALVIVDPALLTTLPAAHLASGLAEAVKAAAIRDPELFGWIEVRAEKLAAGESGLLARLIERCIRIKADVVSIDPTEKGLREILNFGHTAGHALEVLSSYAMLHGIAVATGMRIEARLGEAAGITEAGTAGRLEAVLAACGIADPPASVPTPSELLEAAASDKKARRGMTRWVLLERIGAVARAPDGSWSHALGAEDAATWLSDALRVTAHVRDFG